MISGKIRTELWLLLVVLMFFINQSAWADLSLAKLMEQFARIASADTRFKEEKHLELLEAPLILEGTLSYRAPDYLKKEVQIPEYSLFEINGDSLHIEKGNEQHTLSLDSHPLIRAFAESYRAILSGNIATLERHFETELTGTIENWTLRLTPRDEQVHKYIDTIIMTGRSGNIHTTETLESTGDTSLMTIILEHD